MGWLDGYRNRRCLVTGHTGFKGAWLCAWLHTLGAEVTGYALDPPTEPHLYGLARLGEWIDDRRGDVRDMDRLARAMDEARPEIVFHLAAQAIVRRGYDDPKATFDINAGGTVNALEAARQSESVRAVVVVTSDKCYENVESAHAYRESDALGGHDPYSASKGTAEIVASAYARSFFETRGVGLATARAGNVIGGGDWAPDRIVPDAVRALAAGQPIAVRHPGAVRPWQHVLEPLSGYLLLGARLFEGGDARGAWNFGPETASCCSVRELVETFLRHYGSGTWTDVSDRQSRERHEARLLSLSWDKARERLGWRPQWDLDTAVRRTSVWYRGVADGADARALCLDDIRAYEQALRAGPADGVAAREV